MYRTFVGDLQKTQALFGIERTPQLYDDIYMIYLAGTFFMLAFAGVYLFMT